MGRSESSEGGGGDSSEKNGNLKKLRIIRIFVLVGSGIFISIMGFGQRLRRRWWRYERIVVGGGRKEE